MRKFVRQAVENNTENYLLPLFWQHGESEETLREYVKAIYDANIRAFCIEPRPHPDYLGEGWWRDLDILLDEAKQRNMKVWFMDDAHFPTGYAAGALRNAPEEKKKQYLCIRVSEICGPIPEATLYLQDVVQKREIWLAVVAGKVVSDDCVATDLFDLTEKIHEGRLEWDVPAGLWRIFVLVLSPHGGGREHYINLLDESSCKVLLDTVYEAHYRHYKEEFGNTVAGFFFDEPSFGNVSGFSFDESIGRKQMQLPWSSALQKRLEACMGGKYLNQLPALWMELEDNLQTAWIRYCYMNEATKLVKENFSWQISHWCEAHGVQSIGHVIEDANEHSRLGSGMGHYFRALSGQHKSGIDAIGNQVIKGGENSCRITPFGKAWHGVFFHFELGKLGSSLAHIDPRKNGQALCEIFGASGWNTGVRTMKYLVDHFLVRGINWFMPHAFSPKTFPDPDCPPHFYAHGFNPQYHHFGALMQYLNRMCHLFNNGINQSPVAVLYHGEAEWTGDCMFIQEISKELLEHQIDFDIIPSDVFEDMERWKASFGDILQINGRNYRALVIPCAEFLTEAVASFVQVAQKRKFPVFFTEKPPCGILGAQGVRSFQKFTGNTESYNVVKTEKLANVLRANGIYEIEVSEVFSALRYYHYSSDCAELYLFLNESPSETFRGEIRLPAAGSLYRYQVMENRIYEVSDQKEDNGKIQFSVELCSLESAVFLFDEIDPQMVRRRGQQKEKQEIREMWKVSVCESEEYPNFRLCGSMKELHDIGRILPNFSGYIRYESTFQGKREEEVILEIEDAYEGVEVWVNEEYAGRCICQPYHFDISNSVQDGRNRVRIEVATTLYRKVRSLGKVKNVLAPFEAVIEPSGIVGKVKILYQKFED